METIPEKYSHIKGWGVDADPKNEPTYPMKRYTGADHDRLNWTRPAQQPTKRIEILTSIERPNITAVFGTASPPSGLSGMIRRIAFQQSESTYARWLPLVVADRINVVEGVIDDLLHGHIPNIWAEKGYNAAWKHNRKGVITKIAACTLASVALVGFMLRKRR